MEEQKKPAQRHYAPRAECKIKRFQLHVYFQHQAHARYIFGERSKHPGLPQYRISPAKYHYVTNSVKNQVELIKLKERE